MNHCLYCGNETTNPKYCSKSCSAKVTNTQRTPRSKESRKRTSDSMKINGYRHPKGSNGKPKFSKVSWCIMCGCVIKHKIIKTCSSMCNSLRQSEVMKSVKRTGKNYTKRQFYTSPTAGKVFLESSWEILLAKSLDDNNVNWIRPKYFNYTLDGNRKSYYPDFYLVDYDLYLDPKNDYQRRQDERKLKAVTDEHQIRLILLSKEECSWDYIKTIL